MNCIILLLLLGCCGNNNGGCGRPCGRSERREDTPTRRDRRDGDFPECGRRETCGCKDD